MIKVVRNGLKEVKAQYRNGTVFYPLACWYNCGRIKTPAAICPILPYLLFI